jgi:Acyl-protein synthetase, LuxE
LSRPEVTVDPSVPVFGLAREAKRHRLEPQLWQLTEHHRQACAAYARVLDARGEQRTAGALEDLPMLPVRLFKHALLSSIAPEQVFRTLSSSGTSGQAPSTIVLDKATAQLQTQALVRILQDFIGKARMPMLLIDHPGVLRQREAFSARGAGLLGMMNFGRAPVWALREDMSLDEDAVRDFASQHGAAPVLLFGFTYMVWQHFVLALRDRGLRVALPGGVLLHSGGWKKLQAQAVGNAEFRRSVADTLGITRVHNFYGMAEQVGSVFVECEQGHLHAPAFADVLVRDPVSLAPLPAGARGLLQVLSCLPHSYPGHSLLTEDLGAWLGEDDCPCGRRGRYFEVHGRLPKAELRGCSDTQPGSAGEARS